MLGDGPIKVQGVGWQMFLSVLIWCYYMKYFRHHFLIIIRRRRRRRKRRRKEKPTCCWHIRNTNVMQTCSSRIFKCMVPVDYSFQSIGILLSIKTEVSGTFPFTCPVNSFASFLLQMSNLTLCTALSTWSPRVTRCNLYLNCWSLASWAKCSFHFSPPKINGSNSKYISALIA